MVEIDLVVYLQANQRITREGILFAMVDVHDGTE
jgi:hypothetical protein